MRAYELDESAVEELKDRLPKLKRHTYDTIDNLMQHVCTRHKITGKKLHDMFVKKYGHTPDTWIKKYKNKLGEQDTVNEITKQAAIAQYKDIQNYKHTDSKTKPKSDTEEFFKITVSRPKKEGVEENLSRRGFLQGLGLAAAGAAGLGASNAIAGPSDPGFFNKVEQAHDDMMEKNPRYAKEHNALNLYVARGIAGAAAENNRQWAMKTAQLLQKYGVKLNEGVAEGEVLPLKRPMSKVQHGKRTFPPTQRDVKEPEGNVTPLNQKKSNVSEGVEGPDDVQKIKDFIKWSYKTLNMQKPYPKITISKNTKVAQAGHHTGVHKGNDIWVYVGNRNLIDIFRTIFHELTHHRQMQLNMIKDGDSYPGSPIEMLADMAAGKYLKVYGKMHPEMFQ